MSRRDTIIIAVLINAGLLLVLFATALPSKEEELGEVAAVEQETIATPESAPQAIAIEPRDEVDLVLSEWNIKPGEGTLEVASEGHVKLASPAVDSDSATLASLSEEAKESATSDYTQVTVKKGDALEKIARAHGTSVQEITRLNQLSSSSTLQVGQVLKVPSKKETVASSTKNKEKKELKSTPKSGEKEFYTVKNGDSPWLIANRNHINLEDLLKLNSLDEAKARKLKPGDKLRIK